MYFRITTLLYFFALVAASLAVFGAWGGVLLATGIILLGVATRQGELGVGCGLFALGWCLLVPGLFALPMQNAREGARSSSCMGHLKQLSLALMNYELTVGTLPPATASLGTSGNVQSWRVVVLPYMEGTSLFNSYKLNEPWNGPHNSTLPNYDLLECPTNGMPGRTSYLAVVGPECVWHDGPPRKLTDITDPPSQTIALIDVGRSDIDWKEPRDLTYDQALEWLTAPVDPLTFSGHFSERSIFRNRSYFVNVAMLDMSIRQLRVPLDRQTARALLTINGGEKVEDELLDDLSQAELRYDRIYGIIVLATIVLLPLVPAARRRIWPSSDRAPSPSTTPISED